MKLLLINCNQCTHLFGQMHTETDTQYKWCFVLCYVKVDFVFQSLKNWSSSICLIVRFTDVVKKFEEENADNGEF